MTKDKDKHTGPRRPPKPPRPPEDMDKVKGTIMQLSELCDLVGLRVQLIDRSNYGKKPYPSDPWGYTRDFLAYYAESTDPQQVITLFEGAGCKNDIEAARWLVRHDKIVP